jgi:hypothetical protein
MVSRWGKSVEEEKQISLFSPNQRRDILVAIKGSFS